jgi:hypothetical protein
MRRSNVKNSRGILLLVVLAVATGIAMPPGRAAATPVGTAFTYQGVVQKNGLGITGACSIRFSLYDALTGGSLAGSPSQNTVAVTASNGLFTTTLDFGATAFNANNARWLEIEVEGPGDVSYTTLTPRQPVSPAPYAIYALNGAGGSLTLPFSGSASLASPAFQVTNPNASGSAVYGDGGFAGIEGTGGGFAGVYGHTTVQYGVYGSTTSNTSGGVRGANFGSGPGVEGIGGSGGTAYGVAGTSGSAPGVYGHSFGAAAAVYGINDFGTGAGLEGHSTNGFGIYGTASAATKAGVFGQMFIDNTAGVLGRSESSGPNAQGVYGYASSAGVGVLGISEGNDGMQARSNAAGKSGIWGYSTSPTGYGGAFSNSAGGTALLVSGLAQVGTLQITGADLAESFPVGNEALEPGTVLEIVGDDQGSLRESRSAYDTRVAGVVSGANGMPAGVVLEGHDFESHGKAQVAMSGRVWVKCDATRGAIHVGDLLTTSDEPGQAMRATDSSRSTGAILGKAMTNLERAHGLVLVLVSLQ